MEFSHSWRLCQVPRAWKWPWLPLASRKKVQQLNKGQCDLHQLKQKYALHRCFHKDILNRSKVVYSTPYARAIVALFSLKTFFWVRVWSIPIWPPTYYVARDGLEVLVLLPPPPECWGYRCVTKLSFCSTEDESQGFLHCRQAFYQVSFDGFGQHLC